MRLFHTALQLVVIHNGLTLTCKSIAINKTT